MGGFHCSPIMYIYKKGVEIVDNKEFDAYQQLMKGIEAYVDARLKNDKKDVTMTAIVKDKNENGYSILLDNIVYTDIKTIGGECKVNDTVYVLIPQNNYGNMVILK